MSKPPPRDASWPYKELLTKTSVSPQQFQGHGPVVAVVRAISLLTAFDGDQIYLSLNELTKRTGLAKPTVLRMARTLATTRFLVGRHDGAWRLGPTAGWIGAQYQAQFDLDSAIEPILRELAGKTGVTASFFIYEDNLRSCLMRCEGPDASPFHVRSGGVLPLDQGAPGKVILAALGQPGGIYESIRRRGFHVTRGEYVKDTASVAAAVRGKHGTVLGSVSSSGPVGRLTLRKLHELSEPTMAAAKSMGIAFGAVPATALRATWHP